MGPEGLFPPKKRDWAGPAMYPRTAAVPPLQRRFDSRFDVPPSPRDFIERPVPPRPGYIPNLPYSALSPRSRSVPPGVYPNGSTPERPRGPSGLQEPRALYGAGPYRANSQGWEGGISWEGRSREASPHWSDAEPDNPVAERGKAGILPGGVTSPPGKSVRPLSRDALSPPSPAGEVEAGELIIEPVSNSKASGASKLSGWDQKPLPRVASVPSYTMGLSASFISPSPRLNTVAVAEMFSGIQQPATHALIEHEMPDEALPEYGGTPIPTASLQAARHIKHDVRLEPRKALLDVREPGEVFDLDDATTDPRQGDGWTAGLTASGHIHSASNLCALSSAVAEEAPKRRRLGFGQGIARLSSKISDHKNSEDCTDLPDADQQPCTERKVSDREAPETDMPKPLIEQISEPPQAPMPSNEGPPLPVVAQPSSDEHTAAVCSLENVAQDSSQQILETTIAGPAVVQSFIEDDKSKDKNEEVQFSEKIELLETEISELERRLLHLQSLRCEIEKQVAETDSELQQLNLLEAALPVSASKALQPERESTELKLQQAAVPSSPPQLHSESEATSTSESTSSVSVSVSDTDSHAHSGELVRGVNSLTVEEQIYAANQEIAFASKDTLLKLAPSAVTGKGQDVALLSPSEVASKVSLTASKHVKLAPFMAHYLGQRRSLVKLRQQQLAKQYRQLLESYKSASGLAVAKRETKTDYLPPSRSSSRVADAVKTDYEEQHIMHNFQAVELLKNMTKMPTMVLDPWQKRWNSFDDRNGLVEDPEAEITAEKVTNPWCFEEKRIFMEKFLQHPKDFRAIATYLEGKTTGDCVAFFYKHQKLDEFAAVRRKQQLKKRRLQAETKRQLTAPLFIAPTARHRIIPEASSRGRGRGRGGGRGRGRSAQQQSILDEAPVVQSSVVATEDSVLDDGGATVAAVGVSQQTAAGQGRRGASYWTPDEKEKFLDIFKSYGRDWSKLADAIPTKSMAQIKTFYQNYKTKYGLDKMELPASAAQPSRKPKTNKESTQSENLEDSGVYLERPVKRQAVATPPPVIEEPSKSTSELVPGLSASLATTNLDFHTSAATAALPNPTASGSTASNNLLALLSSLQNDENSVLPERSVAILTESQPTASIWTEHGNQGLASYRHALDKVTGSTTGQQEDVKLFGQPIQSSSPKPVVNPYPQNRAAVDMEARGHLLASNLQRPQANLPPQLSNPLAGRASPMYAAAKVPGMQQVGAGLDQQTLAQLLSSLSGVYSIAPHDHVSALLSAYNMPLQARSTPKPAEQHSSGLGGLGALESSLLANFASAGIHESQPQLVPSSAIPRVPTPKSLDLHSQEGDPAVSGRQALQSTGYMQHALLQESQLYEASRSERDNQPTKRHRSETASDVHDMRHQTSRWDPEPKVTHTAPPSALNQYPESLVMEQGHNVKVEADARMMRGELPPGMQVTALENLRDTLASYQILESLRAQALQQKGPWQGIMLAPPVAEPNMGRVHMYPSMAASMADIINRGGVLVQPSGYPGNAIERLMSSQDAANAYLGSLLRPPNAPMSANIPNWLTASNPQLNDMALNARLDQLRMANASSLSGLTLQQLAAMSNSFTQMHQGQPPQPPPGDNR